MGLFKFKFPGNAHSVEPKVNLPQRTRGFGSTEAVRKVWAIGGGKGGIGKTLLSSNIAVYLTWLNKKVVAIDMDLGGANLHTSLGVTTPKGSLLDLLTGSVENMEDLLQPTPVKNLFLISGAQDPLSIANMPQVQKARLLRKFRELEADVVLLDLGAGTTNNTLDFFLLADEKIIVVTPDPTSIENAYRFIKAAFYRMLRSSTPSPYVRQLVEQAMDKQGNSGVQSPRELLQEVKRLSPTDGAELEERMREFQLSLILNQVRVNTEAELGRNIQMVCERYFGIQVDNLGYLPYDNSVWQSIRRRVPFLMDAPTSQAVTHLEEILRNVIKNQNRRRGPIGTK